MPLGISCTRHPVSPSHPAWGDVGLPPFTTVLMLRYAMPAPAETDVFKLKAANRGDPVYEGPLHAYEQLVSRQRRLGLYRLVCAEPSSF
jgi:hypothetical protein